MTVTPSAGHEYKTAKAAREDWNKGVDFLIADFFHPYDGKPINKSQADAEGLAITLRFCNLTKVAAA